MGESHATVTFSDKGKGVRGVIFAGVSEGGLLFEADLDVRLCSRQNLQRVGVWRFREANHNSIECNIMKESW